MQEASLNNAQLQGASLRAAQLQGASLDEAQLQEASLDFAQLQGAWLQGAQLQEASLNNAQLQGAWLQGAQLQEASLNNAQLQGVFSSFRRPPAFLDNVRDINTFEIQINYRIDEDSDFSTVVFTGGLGKKRIAKIEETLKQIPTIEEEEIQEIMDELKPHVGKQVGHELPEDAGATSGRYTKAEAEQWIQEYNEAMEAR